MVAVVIWRLSVEPTDELGTGQPSGMRDATVVISHRQLEDTLCQIYCNGRSIHDMGPFQFVSADATQVGPAGTMMPNKDR